VPRGQDAYHDASVARLGDIVAGGHGQLRFAKAVRDDTPAVHAMAHQAENEGVGTRL
jgi:hypothetical protein